MAGSRHDSVAFAAMVARYRHDRLDSLGEQHVNRPHVLAVGTTWRSGGGGVSTFNRELCIALAVEGAEVCCLLPDVGEDREVAGELGVELIEPVPPSGVTPEEAMSRPVDRVTRFNPDLIIGHGRWTGEHAKKQAEISGAKRVHILHTWPDDLEQHKADIRLPYRIAETKLDEELQLARSATRSAAVGPLLHKELTSHFHDRYKPEPLRLDPGFDRTDIAPRTPNQIQYILLIGRLEDAAIKGLDIVAHALDLIRPSLDKEAAGAVRLLLRGVPDDQQREVHHQVLHRAANWPELRVLPRSFTLSESKLQDDIGLATVVVMPSRAEGYGLVGAEAIMAGAPVLISDTSGLAHHLRGTAPSKLFNRVIVETTGNHELDAPTWSKKIKKVLQYPEDAIDTAYELAQHMRSKVTWAAAAKQLLDLIPARSAGTATPIPPVDDLQRRARPTDEPRQRRDLLSVLVRVLPATKSSLMNRLPSARHVLYWTGPGATDVTSATHMLSRANAVIFVVTDKTTSSSNDVVLRQFAEDRWSGMPVVVVRAERNGQIPDVLADRPVVDMSTDLVAGERNLLWRLDELGKTKNESPSIASDHNTIPAPVEYESSERPRFVNDMPQNSTAMFLDRVDYLQPLGQLIKDRAFRLVLLHGYAGDGKTALVRRLREDPGQACPGLHLDGIVYLSGRGHRWVTPATFLTDVARAAGDRAESHSARDEQRPWRSRLDAVLDEVGDQAVLVVLDDADDLFDDHGECTDRELYELLRSLVERSDEHAITVLMCVRELPDSFLRSVDRYRTTSLELDHGLPRKWAATLLRNLDDGGDLGLADASDAQLQSLVERTKGHPRSLELAVGLMKSSFLKADSVAAQLVDVADVSETLLWLVLEHLDRSLLRVLQALAIYGRPVPPKAVNHLLVDIAPHLDGGRILTVLTERNLARRRGNFYYLPTVPDTNFFRKTLFDSNDRSGGLDKPTLWRRAATYFHENRVSDPQTVGDLSAQFGEIQLHLDVGEVTSSADAFQTAFGLMEEIDTAHLEPWGQSQILAPWRRRLRGRLGAPKPEILNRSSLVRANAQQDGHPDDSDDITAALRLAREKGIDSFVPDLEAQLANVKFATGDISTVARIHQLNVARFVELKRREKEISARIELVLCRARTGSLDEARQQLASAWGQVGASSAGWTRRARIRLLDVGSLLLRELGHDEEAMTHVDQALALVDEHDEAMRGDLLHTRAQILLYGYDPLTALAEADRAARIGLKRDNYKLSRDALITKALALLVTERPEAALRAADAAAAYSRTPQALDALAIQGLAAYRTYADEKALSSFRQALVWAEERLERDDQVYPTQNIRGLTLCGLALLGDRAPDDAVDAYESARTVTAAPGVLRRNRLFLGQFGLRSNPDDVLDRIRAVNWPIVEHDWTA